MIEIKTVEQSLRDVERDAKRYRWLREQIKDERTRVEAQALFWNYNSRKEFDKAVDEAMVPRFLGLVVVVDPAVPPDTIKIVEAPK